MNIKRIVSSAIVALSFSSPAFAGSGPKPMSGPYINWDWPTVVTQMDVDMTFSNDPGNGTPVFLSNQFTLVDANSTEVSGGYVGVQGNMIGTGNKGAMFSIWNATGATPGPNASCQPFGGEGIGYQCFMPYEWVVGKTYRLTVIKNAGVNFSAYITDTSLASPTAVLIGNIDAPIQNLEQTSGSPAGIGGFLTQWAEQYQGNSGCDTVPYVKLLWAEPLGDQGAVSPTPWTNNHYNYGEDNVFKCHNTALWANGSATYMDHGTPGTASARQLRTHTGNYVYAASTNQGCGGSTLNTDSAAMRDCSQITRIALPNGKVALQTDSGHYLACANGGGSSVTADARSVTANATFTETTQDDRVFYQTQSGAYLSAANGSTVLSCDGINAGVNQGFTSLPNIAPTANVSVSSESSASQQQGSKAIDGVISGFPFDSPKEWATNGQGVGAWLELNWQNPTTIAGITLYDRPNTNDQILGGTLQFSDGSSVTVGALPNDGATGLSLDFSPRNITWVRLNVNNALGSNVGLSEIQVWPGTIVLPTCTAYTTSNDQHVSAGRATKTTSGSWWFPTTTYKAVGSLDTLGSAGTTQTTLSETSPGYFELGPCPPNPDIPVIDSIAGTVSGQTFTVTGTASDGGNNLSVVEMSIAAPSQTFVCQGTTSFTCTVSGLANGSYQATVIASDSIGNTSQPSTLNFSVGQNCFSATNGAHQSTGRATLKYGILYYSTGGNDYLGSSASTVTVLNETTPGIWKKVTSCN